MKRFAPLSSSFMIVSIMGLLISLIWIWKFNSSWAFALTILFASMVIASLVSMQKSALAYH